jgi:hypothetical protein
LTAAEINEDFKRRQDYKKLLLLCRMVIDQAKMGENYLILFLKRDRWDEFKQLVKELSDG